MIQINTDNQTHGILWHPRGSLLCLEVVPSINPAVVYMSPISVQLIRRDPPHWEGYAIWTGELEPSIQHQGIVRLAVDLSGQTLCLNEQHLISIDPNLKCETRVFSHQVWRKLSPEGCRFLATERSRTQEHIGFLELTFPDSTIVQNREPEVRRVQFFHRPDRTNIYFGFEKNVLFVNRELGFLDLFEIVPKKLGDRPESGQPIFDWQLIRTDRFIAPEALVREVWRSSDWRLAIFEFAPRRVRGEAQAHRYLLFDFEEPNDLVPLSEAITTGGIQDLGIHPTNRFLAVVRPNSPIAEIFDLSTQTCIRQFNWQSNPLRGIDFSHDGTMIAAVSGKNKIIVWDVDF